MHLLVQKWLLTLLACFAYNTHNNTVSYVNMLKAVKGKVAGSESVKRAAGWCKADAGHNAKLTPEP
jgi:hypothetical protein